MGGLGERHDVGTAEVGHGGRTRRSVACGAPEDAVTVHKRRQVARLAELWLAARPGVLAGVQEVRFDVLAVDFTSTPAQIRHLPAAFDAAG